MLLFLVMVMMIRPFFVMVARIRSIFMVMAVMLRCLPAIVVLVAMMIVRAFLMTTTLGAHCRVMVNVVTSLMLRTILMMVRN